VFGPLQDPGLAYAAVVPAFILAALQGKPLVIYGDGEQSRDFTFVDSVAEVLAKAAASRLASDNPVNLAFGTRVSLNELVVSLSEVLGRRLDVEYHPRRTGDVRHSQASVACLRGLVPEITPVPLRSGLLQTVEWMITKAESTGVPA
jgi:UDP-glucose 4-epimerase